MRESLTASRGKNFMPPKPRTSDMERNMEDEFDHVADRLLVSQLENRRLTAINAELVEALEAIAGFARRARAALDKART